jgi:hypothetical protein
MLLLVLYGCEIWSLTLREERRPRAFENRVLRKIFGPKEGEVTGERISLHTVDRYDPHSLLTKYYSGHQMKNNEAGMARGTYGRQNRYVLGLAGRPDGKRSLSRPRHRRDDNIKMDVQKVGWDVTDWIDLAQDRNRWWAVVNAAISFPVP